MFRNAALVMGSSRNLNRADVPLRPFRMTMKTEHYTIFTVIERIDGSMPKTISIININRCA